MKLEIGSYELDLDVEATRAFYESLPPYEGEDVARRYFQYLLPRGEKASLAFLSSLGILWEKLSFARPVTEPDESGEVIFLCTARLAGALLRGGDTEPRQSEEEAGISMIFVGEKDKFDKSCPSIGEREVEMRFVIPLPFDPAFFETL